MIVRAATANDASVWCRMRDALWPSVTNEHATEIAEYFAGTRSEPQAVLIACDDDGSPVGFVELSIRAFAEGCYSGRVGYLEGLYVVPEARRNGVGRALISAAEAWGRSAGCTEFASDTEITNDVSALAHQAFGFTEVNRTICYRKDL